MQNNVKLLAVRYLLGLVLLGGGWEEGWDAKRCWGQDPHLVEKRKSIQQLL